MKRKFSLKTVLAVICITMFATSFLSYVLSSNGVGAGRDLYFDDLPSTASYVIDTDGTYIWATRYDGYVAYGDSANRGGVDGTNASAVINAALDNLTSGRDWEEKVYVKGDFTINSPITVAKYTHFILDGKITLADNSDCNMIEAKNTSDCGPIIIEGGVLEGNSAGQSSVSHCIYFYVSNYPTLHEGKAVIRNMRLRDPNGDCLFINHSLTGGLLWDVSGVQLHEPASGYSGLHLLNIADGSFHDILECDGSYLNNVGFSKLETLYINNQLKITVGNKLQMNGISIDTQGVSGAPLDLYSLDDSALNNFLIRVIGDGTDLAEACDMDGTCGNNTFTNFQIGRFGGTGTRGFTWGIYESDANQDHNIYSVINAYDTTYGIKIQGANSHANLCWNGTSWIS